MGMTVTREELRTWDRQFVWHPFTQMAEYEPLLIERAQGCTLVDVDGRTYLDGVSSLWCNVHGHRHPRLDAALRQQLEQVAHVTSLGVSNPTTVRLAKRLVDVAPAGLQHVFFSGDGACAVEVALKLAFQYWHAAVRSASAEEQVPGVCRGVSRRYVGQRQRGRGDAIPSRCSGPCCSMCCGCRRQGVFGCPAGVTPETACAYHLGLLEEALRDHHQELAAVVLEPLLQCAAGMIAQPAGYLRGVRELTRRYDVLLIADEVAVGFGRTGTLFACEQEGVAPICCAWARASRAATCRCRPRWPPTRSGRRSWAPTPTPRRSFTATPTPAIRCAPPWPWRRWRFLTRSRRWKSSRRRSPG